MATKTKRRKDRIVLSVKIDKAVKVQLERYADKIGHSVSTVVRDLLKGAFGKGA